MRIGCAGPMRRSRSGLFPTTVPWLGSLNSAPTRQGTPLEPDQALLTRNCSVPVITWRSNDELLIQCSDCTTDNVQLVKPSFFPGRITLRGLDGKRMYPQVTHPQPGCPD